MKVYRHYGHGKFDSEKFDPVKNERHFCKPMGGLWGSPVGEPGTWEEWCRSESFHMDLLAEFFDFKLREGARVALIDRLWDLQALMDRYAQPIDPTWMYPKRYLDFEKIKADWDAIELTSDGQWATRISEPDLYGWDCASILVLNPDVVEPVRKRRCHGKRDSVGEGVRVPEARGAVDPGEG